MTRLLTTGFETGDTSDVYASDVPGNVTVQTSPVRTGGYCLRISNNSYAQLRSFGATDVLYGGFAFYVSAAAGTNKIFQIMDGTGNITIAFRTNASNFINYYMGDHATLLGTGVNAVGATTWNYLEFYYYIADASGRLLVKFNGTNDVDFTGDSKPSTATTVTAVRLMGGPGAAAYNYFDDVVINDDAGSFNNSYPGAIKLEPIRPTAAGDVTQLTRGGTDSGANWSQVEEVPASATDYVYHTVVDNYDLYNLGTFTLPSGAMVRNVIAIAAGLLDSGAGNIALMIKSGATTASGSDQALSGTMRPYEQVWNTNPDDSQAWEQADIDGLQAGVKVR